MTAQKKVLSAQAMARQLTDMHVKHELSKFDEEAMMGWFKEDLEQVMGWLRSQTLESLVSAAQVKSTIYDTVVMYDIPGAVAEIAGESALKHFDSSWHLETPLKDLMDARQFEGILDKVLELEHQINRATNKLVELPAYKELISGVLYGAITRYIYDSNLISKKVPGVSSMLKMSRSVVNKAAPKLGGAVEDNVRSFIEDNLSLIQQESKAFLNDMLAEDDLKASIMDFWDAVEDRTMAEYQEGMDAMDLADLVVLGYEFWLKFRKTPYFKSSYESIVDYWFEKYGASPLSELFDDLDVQSDTILREAQRYAPKCLSLLKESGELEGLIRRRLEGFYFSKEAIECLGSGC